MAGDDDKLTPNSNTPQAESSKADKQAKQKPVYDEDADAHEQIKSALKLAKRDQKRVLLAFGGNWCGWCLKLHKLFDEDNELGSLLSREYAAVWIDTKQLEKHEDLADEYKAEIGKSGVPFLAVLDADGKVLVKQNTGDLEVGPKHDPEKVKSFLETWVAPSVDAEKVLADSFDEAGTKEKLVLLTVGAPWCGWCHKLEDFLADNHELFDRDYLTVKIDIDRMKKGTDVAERLGRKSDAGVPWIAILDPKGEVLVTSDGPNGNIGYPGMPEEIEHFMTMIKKTAKHSTPEQIAELEDALKKNGEEIRRRLKR